MNPFVTIVALWTPVIINKGHIAETVMFLDPNLNNVTMLFIRMAFI